jgi:hypothetical protein
MNQRNGRSTLEDLDVRRWVHVSVNIYHLHGVHADGSVVGFQCVMKRVESRVSLCPPRYSPFNQLRPEKADHQQSTALFPFPVRLASEPPRNGVATLQLENPAVIKPCPPQLIATQVGQRPAISACHSTPSRREWTTLPGSSFCAFREYGHESLPLERHCALSLHTKYLRIFWSLASAGGSGNMATAAVDSKGLYIPVRAMDLFRISAG